jgi:alpha-L-fucosidase
MKPILSVAFVAWLGLLTAHADDRAAQYAATLKAGADFQTNGFAFNIAPGPVAPDAKAFAAHYRCPDWFRDAKFGIYMHWGLNTVSGFNGHYGRYLYAQEEPQAYRDDRAANRRYGMSGYTPGSESVYRYHVERFGHATKFGYKDLIPLWKPVKFNASELAAFYKSCGARFIGVMAVHHDNFDLYDSKHQPWNSVRMGLKLDIVGAWKRACKEAGVYFFVTSHLSNEWHEHAFFQGQSDTSGPLKDVPYDTTKPENAGLYGERTPDGLRRLNPRFAQSWYLRTKDLIDTYDPDLLYLDGGLPNGPYGLHLAAHFYNRSITANGKLNHLFAIKRIHPKGFLLDIEAAGIDRMLPEPFLVDTTLNPGWFYLGDTMSRQKAGVGADAGMQVAGSKNAGADRLRLTADQVIDNLADIVSKNGNMMLNVGLRPDGSLPEAFRAELVEIGEWLKLNGDAIYGTRPYRVFGEGTAEKPKSASHFNDHEYRYTAQDIRFTFRKGTGSKPDVIHAICLGIPDAPVRIMSLTDEKVRAVTLVGSDARVEWARDGGALVIQPAAAWPGMHAVAFRIELER